MSWTVEYLAAKQVVVIIAKGEISNQDVETQLAETIRLLKQHQASRVLADYSEALSEVSLATLYWLPDSSTQFGAPWNARMAVVMPRTRYRLETYHFLELVFRNAGYNVRLFDKLEAGENWLQQSLVPQPRVASSSQSQSLLLQANCP